MSELITVGFGVKNKKSFQKFINWCYSCKNVDFLWNPVITMDCVVVYNKNTGEKIGWYGVVASLEDFHDTEYKVDKELWEEYIESGAYYK